MPGRLSVTSDPPGAAITIDKQRVSQSTNFTFMVSPGSHAVTVIAAALPKCATPVIVAVRSNSVTLVHCAAAGWSGPTYNDK
ncbi:MAG: PEGA domain-containing protein [Candidatus Sulfopaludibacter sp.]|nr:PEGA domain-containing protein [Candidatus Sulfopaludibacter sp.]